MSKETLSEIIFEEFCVKENLVFDKIPVSTEATPDYKIIVGNDAVIFEIKEIRADKRFQEEGVSSRKPGQHVRAKIHEARKQAKASSKQDKPFVLIVYNNLDPWQLFGTESHDFIVGMYGDMTLLFDKSNNALDSFYGKNKSLALEKNTSFSAVGHMIKRESISIILYENPYAKNKLPILPSCFCVAPF